DANFATNMFDGLLKFNDQYQIVPDIATDLPDVSGDGLTYTFHLRQGVKFWNGDPVTADDFIYSWNRSASAGGAYATELAAIQGFADVSAPHATVKQMSGLSASDPYTLVAELRAPAGYF